MKCDASACAAARRLHSCQNTSDPPKSKNLVDDAADERLGRLRSNFGFLLFTPGRGNSEKRVAIEAVHRADFHPRILRAKIPVTSVLRGGVLEG